MQDNSLKFICTGYATSSRRPGRPPAADECVCRLLAPDTLPAAEQNDRDAGSAGRGGPKIYEACREVYSGRNPATVRIVC